MSQNTCIKKRSSLQPLKNLLNCPQICPEMLSTTDLIFRQQEMSGWIKATMQHNTIGLIILQRRQKCHKTHTIT